MRTTLLLALIAAAAIAQESKPAPPRQTFERAAYAAEHDRDFEKAAALFLEAGRVAESLGDAKLAADAMTALKRVEARMGKGTDTAPSGQDVPAAVQRRLYVLVKQLSGPPHENGNTHKNDEAITQIVPFGAAAVAILEHALHAETIFDPENAALSFRGDSTWAARALERIKVPLATAVLLNGLKSPDPFIRSAIAAEVYRRSHRKEFDEVLLKDPSPAVVAKALRGLSRWEDADLEPVMKAALLRGDDEGAMAAGGWFGRRFGETAESLLGDEKLMGLAALNAFLDAYVESRRVDSSAKAGVLLAAADASKSIDRKRILLYALGKVIRPLEGTPAHEDLRNRAETIALQVFERGEQNDDPWLVAQFAGLRSAELLVKSLAEGRIPQGRWSEVTSTIQREIEKLKPSEFRRGAALAMATAVAVPDSKLRVISSIGSLARKGVADADLEAAFREMPESLRRNYLEHVVMSLDRAPVPLLRELLALKPEVSNRSVVLHQMIRSENPSTIDDAAGLLWSSQAPTLPAAVQLFCAMAPRNPARALAIVEEGLAKLDSRNADVLGALGDVVTCLPPAEIVPLIERRWKDATPDRKEAFVAFLLRYPADAPHPLVVEFLAKNFGTIKSPDLRASSLHRFSSAIYEPAMDVIGAALQDPVPSVREQARKALENFRKQREALEEFKRWKAGDAEGRASFAELVKLLESPNMQVVEGAVRSLGAIKAKGALPAIVKVLERPGITADLKNAVAEAIKKIGE